MTRVGAPKPAIGFRLREATALSNGERAPVTAADRRLRLVSIAMGLLCVPITVWTTLVISVWPAIALPGLPMAPVAGVVLFVGLTLVASVSSVAGSSGAQYVMSAGPIVAATVLGGPTAAAWVTLIGTSELREFREVPWYGIAANRFITLLPAVAAAFVARTVHDRLAELVADPVVLDLIVVGVAGTAFGLLNGGLAILSVALRQRRSAVEVAQEEWPTARWMVILLVIAFFMVEAYERIAPWSVVLLLVPLGAVLVAEDRDRARWAAAHDPLTNLLNRREFDRRLTTVARAGGSGLLFVDLDGFGLVNNAYGHHVGDEVLRLVGQRLAVQVRPGDVAARIGGDEFAVILRGVDDRTVLADRARSIRDGVIGEVKIDQVAVTIGASVGAILIGPGEIPEVLLQRADQAMYCAKAGTHLVVGDAAEA